jgi:acyl-CoA reductase-like NAD-dependent aldehyde dehydrogenase
MVGNENGATPVLLSKADLDRLRLEQQEWSRLSVRRRVTTIGRAAGWLVENFEAIAEAIELPHPRPVEQTLAAELLPLADAIRFVQRQAARILSTTTLSNSDRPLWTGSVKVRLARDPLGIVLVLGTWNYPLFLTGVHVIQALAAGNGVLLKPAPGAERVSELFCRSLWESGVPRRLLQLLPSGVEHARNAMDLGVDRVVLTGSSLTGRRVLGQLVETLTPATLELSGCDAMFVLSTADLNRVCDAILLGLRLNGSATCIAPRRVLVMPDQLGPLQTRLKERLQFATRIKVFPAAFKLLKQLASEAISQGAEVLCGDASDFDRDNEMLPLVMTGVRPEMRLVQSDLFAPVVSLITVNDWAEAIAADRHCPYALSASVFGATAEAEQRATQIEAGCVVINDCIVPTADPRVPFGGRGESGYGMTRGAEGLLEMTRLKSICVRKGNWLPHLEPPHSTDRSILAGLFKFQHGATWHKRWEGMKEIWKSIRERQAE